MHQIGIYLESVLFRESYPALIASLLEVKELYSTGRSDEKKKAEKAKDILNSIFNVKFSLTLAVLCDVYTIYSQIAVLLQVKWKLNCF